MATLRPPRRESAIDLLFLLPLLVILAVFRVYPLAYGLVLSVHDTKGFDLTQFVGLDHYARRHCPHPVRQLGPLSGWSSSTH